MEVIVSLIYLGVVLLILSAFLVRYYASPHTSLYVQSLVTISFALAFSGLSLLPIDLSLTKDVDDDGDNDLNATILPWHILFWGTFALAWVVLPLAREILLSGHFTTKKRVVDAWRKLLRQQLILLAVAVILIIALAIHLRSINVIPVVVTLGNTYGLLMVAVLLGYGLVALPRSLWRKAKPETELRRAQIMVGAADEALFEAVWEMQDCEFEIDTAVSKITDLDENFSSDVYYKFCVDDLLLRKRKAADLSPELIRRRTTTRDRQDRNEDNRSTNTEEMPTLEDLVEYNCRLKRCQEKLFSAEQRWAELVLKTKVLSEICSGPSLPPLIENQSGRNNQILSTICSHIRFMTFKMKQCWMKYCRSIAFRLIALVAAVLSVSILWSETTLALKMNLSPFSFILKLVGGDDDEQKGILFQVAVLIPLVYMAVCVFSSLFKLSVFGPFCLHGNRQSHGVALAFNAQLLVRLQFSLCYNYLLMLKYKTEGTSCAFSDFMGVMSVVPLFGTSFSVYAPLLVLALCLITVLDIFPRLLAILGFEHEDSIYLGDPAELDAKVNEGIALMRMHVDRSDTGNIEQASRHSVV